MFMRNDSSAPSRKVDMARIPDSRCRASSPVLTVIATGVAVVAAVAQYTVPAMVPALERVPGRALLPGEWWRLFTPVLVQTLGWFQVVANLLSLAVVGAVAERLLGRVRWAVLLVAGTVGGQTAAYLSSEPGGGDSIAICGLAGGVLVALMLRPSPGTRFGAFVVVSYVAALAGWGFGLAVAGAACLCVAVLQGVLLRVEAVRAQRVLVAVAMVCALAMAGTGGMHGVSLVSGMVVAGAMAVPVPGSRVGSPRVGAEVQ